MVVISTLFLTSHAYLKDSSVRIRACILTSQFHSRSANGANDARTAKTAVQLALRQAQLQPQDLQIVEVQHSATQYLREALGGAKISQPQEPWSPSDAIGTTTGWRGLARLGEYLEAKHCKISILRRT